MLYVALVASGVLFVVANVATKRSRRAGVVIFVSGLVLTVAPLSLGLAIPAVPLLTLVLCCLASRQRFFWRSAIAFVLVFALLGLPQVKREMEYAGWRKEFPFESIEKRLPIAMSAEHDTHFDFTEVETLEVEIEQERRYGFAFSRRPELLKNIHERTVWKFVNSPEFGISRMSHLEVNGKRLKDGLRDTVIPQPAIAIEKLRSIDNPESVLVPKFSILDQMNRRSVVDFVHPAGWGYVKDRQHVAGFQAHQFSKVPEPEAKAQVVSVELIGWLRGEPAVYVSENLPAMSELRKAPTRPLDSFEENGLAMLRKGEDLFVKRENGAVRVLGAIRAAKQCIDCHGGQRGNLLGAFSYQLR